MQLSHSKRSDKTVAYIQVCHSMWSTAAVHQSQKKKKKKPCADTCTYACHESYGAVHLQLQCFIYKLGTRCSCAWARAGAATGVVAPLGWFELSEPFVLLASYMYMEVTWLHRMAVVWSTAFDMVQWNAYTGHVSLHKVQIVVWMW